MKKRILHIVSITLLFLSVFITVSCEVENEARTSQMDNNPKLKIVYHDAKHVFKENSNLNKVVGDFKKANVQNRLASSIYNFEIEEVYVQVLDFENYKTYSFEIERAAPTPNLLENYVIKEVDNTIVGHYLLQYPFAINPVTGKKEFQATGVTVIPLENPNLVTANRASCPPGSVPELVSVDVSQVQVIVLCTGVGHKPYETECTCGTGDVACFPGYTYNSTIISYNWGCGAGSNDSAGSDPFANGGAGSSSGSTNPEDGVVTVPFEPQNLNEIKFLQHLSSLPNHDLLNWWYFTASVETTESITAFINQNVYTDENEAFFEELIDLASEDAVEDSNAIAFMIEAKKQNKISNALDEAFLLSVDQYMNIDVANSILDFGTEQLIMHFSIQCAVLRANHPTWSDNKIYWEASKDMVHMALDVAGLVPVFGEIADLTNGVLYLVEEDGVNATLSFAATIPVAGWGATGTKYAFKIIDASQTATTIANRVKLTWKVVGNTIQFGSDSTCRRQLRKVLGLAVGNPNKAHHLIPLNLQTNAIVQKAAKSGNAFHMNEALNGISLNSFVHNGSHGNYDQLKRQKLIDFAEELPNATPNQCYTKITSIIQEIRTAIANSPNTPINQLIF